MTETTETTQKVIPRLKTRYREEIIPALQSEFEIPVLGEIPRIHDAV